MPTICESHTELTVLEATLDKRLKDIEELKGRIQGKRQEVLAQIKAGESMGDPMLDFVVARHAEGYADTIEALQLLNDEFKRHAGELVLLRYLEHVCTKHVFAGPGSEYQWQPRLRIGLITDEGLQFERNPAFCQLPVERFVFLHPPGAKISDVMTSRLFTASTSVSSATPIMLDAPLPKGREEEYTARLAIGDDAVKAFLRKTFATSADTVFAECCERVGKLVLTGDAEED